MSKKILIDEDELNELRKNSSRYLHLKRFAANDTDSLSASCPTLYCDKYNFSKIGWSELIDDEIDFDISVTKK